MITPQYIAGLIDGEGYIGILPVRSKEVKNPSFEPVIKIGMAGANSLMALEMIREVYGGIIEARGNRTVKDREVFTYVLKGKKKILVLINDINPFLIVKRPQGGIIKYFCELPMTHTRHSNFSQEIVTKKIWCYETLKELKKPDHLHRLSEETTERLKRQSGLQRTQ